MSPAGYVSLVLHAHLPFVRHPEHAHFLEENWLFEAITETYLPLLQLLDRWTEDQVQGALTLTLTPTLCAMLQDPLLQTRYQRYLDRLLELAEHELQRTLWEPPFNQLARFYHRRLGALREYYQSIGGDLVGRFRLWQDAGRLEIAASAATHAVLPLLARHPPSIRAQVLLGRDEYRRCFGREPRGFWLPECAYTKGLEDVLREAGFRWFITETHGLLHARPQPRFGIFAPILTPNGLAVFGRDPASAQQVWSRDKGYPGDPNYRDFYRDIGFDLDWDYLRPHLPGANRRGFTGLKYYRITGPTGDKLPYNRDAALARTEAHATHFLDARRLQIQRAAEVLHRPPILLAPYDAELFGHWWYEGPEFLDRLVRKASSEPAFALVTPSQYLLEHARHQVATPAASSWGEAGYWGMWLDEKNEWIYPHLDLAQQRMTALARQHAAGPLPPLRYRVLKQAARELLLAQASDWPFILRTGTSPDYARKRFTDHLHRFTTLFEQLSKSNLDEAELADLESRDNLFPDIDYRYWI